VFSQLLLRQNLQDPSPDTDPTSRSVKVSSCGPALELVDGRREASEALEHVDGQIGLQRVGCRSLGGRAFGVVVAPL